MLMTPEFMILQRSFYLQRIQHLDLTTFQIKNKIAILTEQNIAPLQLQRKKFETPYCICALLYLFTIRVYY